MLEVASLSVSFGRVSALTDVSISVKAGEIVTLLGANGAGKSTLLKALIGTVTPSAGDIRLEGAALRARPPSDRVGRGLVLVPEGRRILISMTIEENLRLGAYQRRDEDGIAADIAAFYDRFPNLAERRHAAASCLSGGEQQMLAIARALMARPRLLMLDEPSLGLSPLLVEQVFEMLDELNRGGLSILLVEQNARKALALAHRAYVLEMGRVTLSGDAGELSRNPRLSEAYLGA